MPKPMITAEYRLNINGLYFNTIGFKNPEHNSRFIHCIEELAVTNKDYRLNKPELKPLREATYVPPVDYWHCPVYISEDFYAYVHGWSISGHWTEGRYTILNKDGFKNTVNSFLSAIKSQILSTFPEISLNIDYKAEFFNLIDPYDEITG